MVPGPLACAPARLSAGSAPQRSHGASPHHRPQPPSAPLRYYEGSDSRALTRVSPLSSLTLPRVPSSTTWWTHTSLLAPAPACVMRFRLRPLLAGSPPLPRRIRFVFPRTASSPPVAPHPASQRRSYLQLRGSGFPRYGLPPYCVSAFTGALGALLAGEQPGMAWPTRASPASRLLHRYAVRRGRRTRDGLASARISRRWRPRRPGPPRSAPAARRARSPRPVRHAWRR